MSRIRPLFFVLIVTAAGLALWLALRRQSVPERDVGEGPPVAPPVASAPAPAPTPALSVPATQGIVASLQEAEVSRLAAGLNAPEGSVQRDLMILDGVLQAWRSNFRAAGNPVGDNIEITAALAGGNDVGVAFIPRDHTAINQRGQLCDRWGTPFFFHQIAGDQMELRSAGPDRRLYTEDDAVLNAAEEPDAPVLR